MRRFCPHCPIEYRIRYTQTRSVGGSTKKPSISAQRKRASQNRRCSSLVGAEELSITPKVGLLAPGFLTGNTFDYLIARLCLPIACKRQWPNLEARFPVTVARPHRHFTDFPGKRPHLRGHLPPRGVHVFSCLAEYSGLTYATSSAGRHTISTRQLLPERDARHQ